MVHSTLKGIIVVTYLNRNGCGSMRFIATIPSQELFVV